MFAFRNAVATCLALAGILAAPAGAEPFDFDAEYAACLGEQEYAIGGAMAGDCFIDQAREIEVEIETLLHQVSKRYCSAEDRDILGRAQSLWLEHRDLSCTLIENSPGNTGSHIAGGACWLDTARKRLETLRILENNAYARCPEMGFLSSASQFGDPSNLLNATGAGLIEDAGEQEGAGRPQNTFGDLVTVLSLDLADCSYCEAEADCSLGLFQFEYPIPEAAPSPANSVQTDKALLHACQKPDGIAFDLIAGLETEARIVETGSVWQAFDWFVDNGRIVLIDGAGQVVGWPGQ